jgi:hypothetical protein
MEALMQRARLALGAGIPAFEVAERLIETGASKEEAFFVVQAAMILIRDEDAAIARTRSQGSLSSDNHSARDSGA